jgi:hypothetical protein
MQKANAERATVPRQALSTMREVCCCWRRAWAERRIIRPKLTPNQGILWQVPARRFDSGGSGRLDDPLTHGRFN